MTFHFPWLFHDYFGIPWLFQVFQESGHLYYNDTNIVKLILHSKRNYGKLPILAVQNNLMLNCRKTKEMVIRAQGKCGKLANPPAPCLDIEQVSSIRILGVTVNEISSAADHVSSLLASSNSLLYVLRVLRVHCIPDESLQEVFRATLLAKIMYSMLALHGMAWHVLSRRHRETGFAR